MLKILLQDKYSLHFSSCHCTICIHLITYYKKAGFMSIKRILLCLIFSLVFMVLGLFIYLSTRTGTYVNAIFENIISLPPILPDSPLNTLLFNWGADFLWAVSFTLALGCFVSKPLAAPVIVFSLGLLFELFQLFGITSGTFDVFDIASELLGVLAGFLPALINPKEK